MTATVTADFRAEYEAERTRFFRRRFLWYTGIFGTLGVLVSFAGLAGYFFMPRPLIPLFTWSMIVTFLSATVYPAAFFYVRRKRRGLPRPKMIRLTFWVLVINAILGIPGTMLGYEMGIAGARLGVAKSVLDSTSRNNEQTEEVRAVAAERLALVNERGASGDDRWDAAFAGLPPDVRHRADAEYARARGVTISPSGSWIINVMVAHILAALFIPWTWREAIKPLIPIIVLNGIGLASMGDLFQPTGIAFFAISPLMGAPGVLIAAFRSKRHRDRFTFRMLKGRYSEIKRELGMAREIHEGLFPDPIREGLIRFEYVYEPMRQIGGDYLYAREVPDGSLHVVIVDVTGHGISAALTVNRLHGELDRLLAENPGAGPAMLLTALNTYMHHTVSGFSVYATVLCMKIDPAHDEVRWSSAGHPPAFLRAVDGTIHHIDSTSIVLGACRGEDFESEERKAHFGRGDTILAYTDGAIESRDRDGKLLGIRGFERMLASGVPDQRTGWAGRLLREVDDYRHGAVEDDVLIVEVFRPVEAPTESDANESGRPLERSRA